MSREDGHWGLPTIVVCFFVSKDCSTFVKAPSPAGVEEVTESGTSRYVRKLSGRPLRWFISIERRSRDAIFL